MFIVNFIRGIGHLFLGLLYPFKALAQMLGPAKGIKVPPWVRAFFHILLIAAIIIVLIVINNYTGLDKQLAGGSPWMRRIWLALIAGLMYVGMRLFLYVLRQIPSPTTEFPDIDEAMDEGLDAIADARINLRDSPLFLVIGMVPEDEAVFAKSSLISRDVSVSGRRLPVHWYGDADSLWVSIPGASALTKQVELAAKSGPATALKKASGGGRAVPSDDDMATLQPGGGGGFLEDAATLGGPGGGGGAGGGLLAAAGGGGDGDSGRFATMAPEQGGSAFATFGGGAPAPSAQAQPQQTSVRRLPLEEKDLATRRLEYFVKRIREVRYPVCPINGILLVLPYEWTSSPAYTQLADVVKTDMHTLQESLGVKGVCVTMFSGLDKSPEFTEYVNRLEKRQVERRCGCSFPPLMEANSTDIENAHAWLVEYFERQVFELFQKSLGDPGNANLFRFLNNFRQTKDNFVRLLNNAFPRETREPFYLGGVYYAGTSRVGKVANPFFDGVIAKLLREHDDVIGWNDTAVAEDRAQQKAAMGVMVLAAGLAVVSAVLLVYLIFLRNE